MLLIKINFEVLDMFDTRSELLSHMNLCVITLLG